MNKIFAFPSSFVKFSAADKWFDAAQSLNLPYFDYGYIPFAQKIVGVYENYSDFEVIPFGGVEILRVGLKNRLPANWKIFYDAEKFDIRNQPREILLNSEFEAHSFLDFWQKPAPEDIFCKPSNDLKLFNGLILEKGQTLEEILSQKIVDSELDLTKEHVIISPYRKIRTEFRFFVTSGRVAAYSFYKGSHIEMDTGKVDRLIASFHPCEAFVVDIALTSESEYKVVEYNALQCSGTYNADVGNILFSLLNL